MSSRNQNKPPISSVNKNRAVDDAPLEKRRKIGTNKMIASISANRDRQPLAPINNQNDNPVALLETEVSESENIEFTKEEIDVLLNEKFKGKKFDLKGKQDWMIEHIKKLKICIKWFQKGLEDAIVSHNQEKEANMTLEKDLDILKKKLLTSEQNLSTAKDKVKKQKDKVKQQKEKVKQQDKNSKEYITSLQQYISKLQNERNEATDAYKKVEEEKAAILKNHTTLSAHYNLLHNEITSARASRDDAVKQNETAVKEVEVLKGQLQKLKEDRERQVSQIHDLSTEIMRYKESTEHTAVVCDDLSIKSTELEETCLVQRKELSELQLKLAAAKEKLKMKGLSTSKIRTKYKKKKDIISDLKSRLSDAETLRKKLHNTILELKGNIRVFCRVRPMLSSDPPGDDAAVCYPPTSTSGELADRGIINIVQPGGQEHSFQFDKVFGDGASQEDVFIEISQLVQSALDGYKVCILAYGQTGSGKTYTMMGCQEAPGLIPRSLKKVFETSQELSAQGWNFKMQASMLEIYNETIRDLLLLKSSNGDSEVGGKKYNISHDSNGNTNVSDLTIVNVTTENEVSNLLKKAALTRAVGKTDMNAESSRSHFVFTLRIAGVNESTKQHVEGVLNLIDLAGSERLSRSGATGERLKETQAINKSLSALSEVILALGRKEDHVPYRNSKLTYLLQSCLGGDSKTLMFVNVSPDPLSVNESLSSLRFAERVNSCEIGIPRRQTIHSRFSYG